MRSLAVFLPVVTASLAAQQLQMAGAMLRLTTFAYSRGNLGMDAGELLARFDADDLAGFGVESSAPGQHVIRGVLLGWRDFGGSLPADIVLYTEDPARPGYPDLQNPFVGATGVPVPTMLQNVNGVAFAQPVLLPQGRDVFVGVRVSATTSTIGGTRLLVVISNTTSFPDVAGPALPISPPEANSYRLYRDLTTDVITYGSRGQFLIDLLTTQPSGMAAAFGPQPGNATAGTSPGTTTFLSGLHPDAAEPPLNAGRIDDVSFVYQDLALDAGSIVLFLASPEGFGPVQPLDGLVAGSVGGFCLHQPSTEVIGIGLLDAGRRAAHVTTIPAATRLVLRGCTWAQQAIGFDAVNGVLRGTQCAQQRF